MCICSHIRRIGSYVETQSAFLTRDPGGDQPEVASPLGTERCSRGTPREIARCHAETTRSIPLGSTGASRYSRGTSAVVCDGSQSPRRKTSPPGSGKVEAIENHDLVPRSHEVTHELLLGVVTRVDLSNRPELRVRTEDEVDAAALPLELAGPARATLEHVLGGRGRLPLRRGVEQVHEEVGGQHLG